MVLQNRAMRQQPDELAALLARTKLPAAASAFPFPTPGLDNELTLVTLADGQRLLLRRPRTPSRGSAQRTQLLQSLGIARPLVHATTEDGTALLEWVDGESLTALATSPTADSTWRAVGEALARVHRVRFPGAVCGDFDEGALTLAPLDWRKHLQAKADRATPWIREHVSDADALLRRLSASVHPAAATISRDGSRLLHGDISLDNVVMSTDGTAILIDWDTPRVGTRYEELASLEQHLYLATGAAGLPSPFWEGYAEDLSSLTLSTMRLIGCLTWLASDDWNSYAHHPALAPQRKAELASWKTRLETWVRDQSARFATSR